MSDKNKIRVLDLFAGCGGLSLGFAQSGFSIIAGIDYWKDALVTFEKNHPGSKGILMDLGKNPLGDLYDQLGEIDIVIGGPPCQGFSISGKRNPHDPRNLLYQGFVKIVKHIRPRAFLLENVPNLVSLAGGQIKNYIVNDFEALGYGVEHKVLLSSDFGVPQNRRRVFFVGLANGGRFEFPNKNLFDQNSKVTCWQAISDLPEKSVPDGSVNAVQPQSSYQEAMRENSNRIFNHQITAHKESTIKIISMVPDGGNYKDLPEHLRDTRKVHIAWTRYSSSKPSMTIDTGHRHHFHYKYNRIPTVRESARLQSFPDDFIFFGSKTSQYEQVGNAVPPLLARHLGHALKKHIR